MHLYYSGYHIKSRIRTHVRLHKRSFNIPQHSAASDYRNVALNQQYYHHSSSYFINCVKVKYLNMHIAQLNMYITQETHVDITFCRYPLLESLAHRLTERNNIICSY
ncbi:T. brucei spp.-specific protein [Trypanosoma brucei gambiense DAL972]|uniref:T. brucei spp.-specific protein n=1 Tax=Trypanosoma brucei gambiense (strain MHOM/CI/86/DAL972) TaxID=679716 RepID=D0A3A3_TRYB9|nr:T. brucei spp.-specific protein [Trypanosoma brucei gambiense DAL972]CBH15747.1 T. brucei spp.-specific protein [Trypanosoma brucei gambiense DAL972]|eukprot:XP_011778011.1 T. brucei spp.-specific protein [Trypanosoma brucei gambiense DAL972]